jgi:hypothetical protein
MLWNLFYQQLHELKISLSLAHTHTHGVVLLHLGWHENPELKSQIRHLET